MANVNFNSKSVKELQNYLKDRGVTFSNIRKLELIEICVSAEHLGIEVDPDGLLEDRDEILKEKLLTPEGNYLPSPDTVSGSQDLKLLPPFAIFDIYNYLLTFEQYNHSMLRNYQKMEAYGLFEDGFVLNIECCPLNNDFSAVKANVKPRTNEKCPITKLKYYKAWIVFNKSDNGAIFSALCSCKGGIDGGCRHVVATLFEICDFLHDRNKASVTEGQCIWVRRASKTSEAVLVTDLDTSLTVDDSVLVKPTNDVYKAIPQDTVLPDPNDFVNLVKEVHPSACLLDAWEKRVSTSEIKPLDVKLPLTKTIEFWQAHMLHLCTAKCKEEFIYHLTYLAEDIVTIEEGTRGQQTNNNWQKAREGLLTSSNFKTICHSTNMDRTSEVLIKESGLNEDNLPAPIVYGRKFEQKARDMFVKSHRFRHRKCKLEVPGLIISSSDPMLGTSLDGIVDCSICGQFIIEIKCLFSHKNFHPSPALLALKICEKSEDGSLQVVKTHRYNYQMQGQMGITGIKKCKLIAFTNKGIFPVDVDFDEIMWNSMKGTLTNFYDKHFLPALLRKNNIVC